MAQRLAGRSHERWRWSASRAVAVKDVNTWIELHGEGAAELIDWATPLARGRIYSGRLAGQNEQVPAALLERGSRPRSSLLSDGHRAQRGAAGASLAGRDRSAQFPRRGCAGRSTRRTWRRSRIRGSTFANPSRSGLDWSLERPRFRPGAVAARAGRGGSRRISLCRAHETEREVGSGRAFSACAAPGARRGLGRALLLESFRRLAARGCRTGCARRRRPPASPARRGSDGRPACA